MYVDEVLKYLSQPFNQMLPKVGRVHRILLHYLNWLSRQDAAAVDEYDALAQRVTLISQNLRELPGSLADPTLGHFFKQINSLLAHSQRGALNLGSLAARLEPEFKRRMNDAKCLADFEGIQEAVVTFADCSYMAQDLILAQPWFYHQLARRLDYVDLGDTLNALKQRCAEDGKELKDLAGRDFEYLAGAFFSTLGFKVYLTAASKDGGFDLVALQREDDGRVQRLLIECKSSPGGRVVGVGVVRALFGVAHAEPSTGGICISSTYFSREAREFHRASAGRLNLVEGKELLAWIETLREAPVGDEGT